MKIVCEREREREREDNLQQTIRLKKLVKSLKTHNILLFSIYNCNFS